MPEVVALLYLTHGNHIPESDGAEYFLYGHRVYERFLNGTFREGSSTLYMLRGWKPTIFHLFLTPFLFLAGGGLYPALCKAILFITGCTTLDAFALMKERLSTFSASVGGHSPFHCLFFSYYLSTSILKLLCLA